VLDQGPVLAGELPRRVRQVFRDFKLKQECHALCVCTGPVDDELLGPTPAQYLRVGEEENATPYEVAHVILGSLLGEPFGWTTIQNAHVLNDIIPIKADAETPASSGFTNDFGLHTEDAFSLCAGDYLGLFCLRNPDSVATTVSGFAPMELSPDTVQRLFEPFYVVGANVKQEVGTITELSPVFFGNQHDPFFRINLNSTRAREGDMQSEAALAEFRSALERNVCKVAMNPGEAWYFDNLRLAHGREKFTPRFDGKDRWLKRIYISSAYRYSAAMRPTSEGHILNPLLGHARLL
jgi:hypothetical protein